MRFERARGMRFAETLPLAARSAREAWPMITKVDTAKIRDLALEMYRHLKELEDSSAKTQHIFRMICAVKRDAAGLLDDAGDQQALKDIEAAALFCQAK